MKCEHNKVVKIGWPRTLVEHKGHIWVYWCAGLMPLKWDGIDLENLRSRRLLEELYDRMWCLRAKYYWYSGGDQGVVVLSYIMWIYSRWLGIIKSRQLFLRKRQKRKEKNLQTRGPGDGEGADGKRRDS